MIQITHGAKPKSNTPEHSTNSPNLAKDVATLRAKLALAGHAVHMTTEGGFWVSKFNLSYFAKDFGDLKAFALKLGVK